MFGFGRLVQRMAFLQDHFIFSCMALMWGDKADAAVLMLVVVPVHTLLCPCPCGCQVGEALARVLWAVFQGAKERFDVGVIIRYPWS